MNTFMYNVIILILVIKYIFLLTAILSTHPHIFETRKTSITDWIWCRLVPITSLVSMLFLYMLFFISNTFISNARLKLTKNKSKAKQHPESELLLFDNYRFSSSALSSFNNKRCSKNCTKNK